MKFPAYCLTAILTGLAIVASGQNVFAQPDCNNRIFYTDKNHASASDSANSPGTSGQPFQTIQKLVDVLAACVGAAPGDITGIVKAATTPYTETGRKSNLDFGGITFTLGGISDSQRIILRGADGERPVVDQQLAVSDNGQPVTGFFIARDATGTGVPASYITIRNFEIINTTHSAVLTDPERTQNNIGIVIDTNHIHHIYGEENIGGIRFDFCRDCVARNNVIHDIYNSRSDRRSNVLNNRPYGLHAGVHGYEPERCVIENNLVFNVDKGVFQKHPDSAGEDAYVVRNNIFYNNSEAGFSPQGNDVLPGINNGEFHHNIVYNSGYGVWVSLQNPTSAGQDFLIYNNTIVNSKGIAKIRALRGVEIFNNIRAGVTNVFGTAEDISIEHDGAQSYQISYFDHNLYYDNANKWVVNLNSGGVNGGLQEYFSSSAWILSSPFGIVTTPDQNSLFGQNPFFVNSGSNDYAVQGSSPALQASAGRGGSYPDYIGAVYQINSLTKQFEDENGNPVGPVLGTHPMPAQISSLSFEN